MRDTMKDAIVGAAVGAIITGIISILIFYLGNFETQKTIVDTLSQRFDTVDKNMSYEQALEAIYNEKENLKNDIQSLNIDLNNLNEDLNKKTAEINTLTSQEEINKIIQNATDYWNDSNFIQSLTLLKNSKSKSSDIEALYKQYLNQYKEHLLSEADSFVSENKYDDAITLINDSLVIMADDTILKQKIEEIKNSKPQALMNLILPYETKGYTQKISSDFMQMGGDKYYNGFQLGNTPSTSSSYAIFNLNSKYTKITGIIGHIDGSGNDNRTITIFADGILINTIDINYQDLPKELLINVEGVNQLKIEGTGGWQQTGFGDLHIQ